MGDRIPRVDIIMIEIISAAITAAFLYWLGAPPLACLAFGVGMALLLRYLLKTSDSPNFRKASWEGARPEPSFRRSVPSSTPAYIPSCSPVTQHFAILPTSVGHVHEDAPVTHHHTGGHIYPEVIEDHNTRDHHSHWDRPLEDDSHRHEPTAPILECSDPPILACFEDPPSTDFSGGSSDYSSDYSSSDSCSID